MHYIQFLNNNSIYEYIAYDYTEDSIFIIRIVEKLDKNWLQIWIQRVKIYKYKCKLKK